jgi:spore germination cell wall hydrolase CwlJ-like protein
METDMKFVSNALTLFIIAALVIIWLQGKPKEHVSEDLSEKELFELTRAIYFEARGEDDLGQAAVAHMILNRVQSPLYPDTVREVVWQKGQFSWTQDGKSARMTDPQAIQKAVDIALAVSRGKIKDPTDGALHYFAHKRVKPYWAKEGFRFILGKHTFVKLAGN